MDPKTRSVDPAASAAPAGDPQADCLQEQLTAPPAAPDERSAAEILAERQAEAASGSGAPSFIP
jgi:hypothetical protein